MKTSLITKVAVSAMAVALGAGVVGSISGTVAWFQYSTRSTVAYQGAAAHCTENLQIRINSGTADDYAWASDLHASDIAKYLKAQVNVLSEIEDEDVEVTVDGKKFFEKLEAENAATTPVGDATSKEFTYDGSAWDADLEEYGIDVTEDPGNEHVLAEGDKITVSYGNHNTLKPVTSGNLESGKIASKLYKNPIYQYADMEKWGEAKVGADYVLIPLELRVLDVDGESTQSFLAKKIYVTDVTLDAIDAEGKFDITPALRVGIETGTNSAAMSSVGTVSLDGSDVVTHGNLDLNNDAKDDEIENYDFEKSTDNNGGYVGTKVDYGYSYELTVEGATYDEAKLIAKLQKTNSELTFTLDGETWKLGEEEAVLAQYGLTPKANVNEITVSLVNKNTAKSSKVADFIADDSDPYSIVGEEIGATTDDATLKVNLMIYLEGWKEFDMTDNNTDDPSALWDAAKTVGSEFNLGIRFSSEAHVDHE